jgi:hypothetical protein
MTYDRERERERLLAACVAADEYATRKRRKLAKAKRQSAEADALRDIAERALAKFEANA